MKRFTTVLEGKELACSWESGEEKEWSFCEKGEDYGVRKKFCDGGGILATQLEIVQ